MVILELQTPIHDAVEQVKRRFRVLLARQEVLHFGVFLVYLHPDTRLEANLLAHLAVITRR
jgi:predicted nucleotidyltransferase